MTGPAKKQRWFFLRGLVRETGHWAGFLEKFRGAFPEREAYGLDLPGNGLRFREKSPCSLSGIVEAMRGEFLQKKGETNFLFALSLGGMVAMEWLRRYPEDFSGAVLVNSSARGVSPFYERLLPANYARILGLMLRKDKRARERAVLEMTSHRRERFPELEAEWTSLQERHPVSVANALRQLLAALRFRPSLEKPGGRILVLNGGSDRLVSPLCSRALAQHWGVPLKVQPGAGHDLTLDAPDWVLEQLKDF